jgi:hypothetical protein
VPKITSRFREPEVERIPWEKVVFASRLKLPSLGYVESIRCDIAHLGELMRTVKLIDWQKAKLRAGDRSSL